MISRSKLVRIFTGDKEEVCPGYDEIKMRQSVVSLLKII